MTRMLGSDAILRSLEAEGVEFMFGIPGGAILPTYDAIARGTTVRHVLARHEQGAGHMAEGYARASGRVGVAMATSGPGRDEPRHRDRRRLDGLDADRLHHRPGAVEPDRHRRVPGDRRHRHHDADRQAFVARPRRPRAAAGDQERLPRRAHRPPRPGARRRRQGRPGGRARLLLPRPTSTCRAGARRRRCTSGRCTRPRRRSSRRSSRSSTPAAA